MRVVLAGVAIGSALSLPGTAEAVVNLLVRGCSLDSDTCSAGGPGSGNGQPEPGESVTSLVSVVNTGTTDATNVTATVTSLTPGVTVTQPVTGFGTIAAGGAGVGTPAIAYTVDSTVLCGTGIVFDVAIVSDQGLFRGNCPMFIPDPCVRCASPPDLSALGCTPVDTCALGGAGDGNGSADPGETVLALINLQNTGGTDATGVTAVVSTATPGVIVTQPNINFNTIAAGATGVGVPPLEYAVDLTVPCGTNIVFDIAVQSDQGPFATTCSALVPVACTPCSREPNLVVQGCALTDSCGLGGAGDNNGSPDPGESISSTLLVSNTGQADADLVTATVTTTTPGVSITQGVTSFGTITAGGGASGSPPITYTVGAGVPCGTIIDFDVAISSTQKNFASSCSAQVPAPCIPCVGGPVLAVAGCDFLDSCAIGGPGDDNGAPDPGESVAMTVRVQNTGTAAATNVTAVVTSTTPGVTVSQPSTGFGTVAASATGGGSPTVDWSTSINVPCGTSLVFDVAITATEGTFSGSCTLPIPSPCNACGSTGTCIVGNLIRIAGLTGVKVAPSGARFNWSAGSGVSEYHLNAVTLKTNLTNIDPTSPRQAPTGAGELRCAAPDPTVTCTDAVALSDPRPLFYYQALPACGSGAADEGPM